MREVQDEHDIRRSHYSTYFQVFAFLILELKYLPKCFVYFKCLSNTPKCQNMIFNFLFSEISKKINYLKILITKSSEMSDDDDRSVTYRGTTVP